MCAIDITDAAEVRGPSQSWNCLTLAGLVSPRGPALPRAAAMTAKRATTSGSQQRSLSSAD